MLPGVNVTDLPRLSQWMNCLTDIINNPLGYDNRESILVAKDSDHLTLVGKGFSRISSLMFAVMKGADIMEHAGEDENMDETARARAMELWEVLQSST